MQVNNIQSNSNIVHKYTFGNNYNDNSKAKHNIVTQSSKAKDSKNNNLYIGLGLSALALVVIGGLSYKKLHGAKLLKNSNGNNQGSLNQTNASYVKSCIDDFLKKLSDSEKYKFDDQLKNQKFSDYKIIDHLHVKDDSFALLKYLPAIKNANIDKTIRVPSVLTLDNVSQPRSKDITKILSSMFDINFAAVKYTKGNMKEFIDCLDDFSKKALAKYEEEKSYTFLHFDKASEFFADLKLKENEEHMSKFNNLLNHNSENKIMYIMDNDGAKQMSPNTMMTLSFDEKINTADLLEDFAEREFKLNRIFTPETQKIDNELAEYIRPNQNLFFMLRNLLFDKTTENIFFIEGLDKKTIDTALDIISSKTNNVFEKVDCSNSIKDLLSTVTKKGEQSETVYNRTGKRTILLLDNIENILDSNIDKNSSEYKELKAFIENCNEQYHTIPVITSKVNADVLSELTNSNNKIFQMKMFADKEKALQDSLLFMQNKMYDNDFSHINAERFKRQFMSLIAEERAGKAGATSEITNGILLYGPDEATRITADAIKNSVDAHYVKVTYNSENPIGIIDGLVDEAKKSEQLFRETGRRTILELDKMDELLTNWKNNLPNILIIGKFKGFVEHISKDYHTTVLLRSSKCLDDFEAASIAEHRFGLQMETK